MWKYAAILPICLLVFCSCGSKDDPLEDHVRAENFVVYTSAEPTKVSMQTAAAETTAAETEVRHLSYALTDNGIDLILGEDTVQELNYGYSPDPAGISIADLNFDGYDDIFVPIQGYGDGVGLFYLYQPDTNKFEENKELNKIGVALKTTDRQTLVQETDYDFTTETLEYQWKSGSLVKISRTVSVNSSDGVVKTEVYKYDSKGNEYLAESD